MLRFSFPDGSAFSKKHLRTGMRAQTLEGRVYVVWQDIMHTLLPLIDIHTDISAPLSLGRTYSGAAWRVKATYRGLQARLRNNTRPLLEIQKNQW